MKQLPLFSSAEVQLSERVATTLIPNPMHSEVTSYVELGRGSLWAAARANVLSPEISDISGADAFHLAEGSKITTVKKRGCSHLTGSEAVARRQKDSMGTRETRSVPQKGVCNAKSINGKVLQKTLWESDKLVVVKKSRNGDEAKGLTVKPTCNRLRGEGDTSSRLRAGQRKSTKLSSLTQLARENPKMKFTSLAHLLDKDFLKGCYREIKRGRAPGVDGVSVEEYGVNLEENLEDLVERLRGKRYRPQPVKRVYITKSSGGKRPLGIPAVEDKVVQMGIKKILECIFEVDFLDMSYGFRPDRSCHDALDVLDKAIMTRPVNWIVDMDIEKFFDTVDHKWMMRGLKQRIKDRTLLRLIERFLRCGVMEGGEYTRTKEGTPQGGVLSPILANIYLHYVIDLWYEKVIKGRANGYTQMVRYADDFVVCFQAEREAREFGNLLRRRLAKFGLTISEEKSKIIHFGRYAWREGKKVETFNFLGFTHYCGETRQGKFMLGRKTAKDRYRRATKEVGEWLKRTRNAVELKELWKMLRVKVTGHYRYYGISGNMRAMKGFYNRTVKMAYKWINRRSQKRSYNWKEFSNFLKYNPLPKPKIYHGYPVLN